MQKKIDKGLYSNGGETNESDNLLEFTIPNYALSSLINGDDSGLEDEDIEKIDKFVNRIVEKYGNANFMLPDEDEMDLGFKYRNDIDGNLGADCSLLYLMPSKKYDEGGETDEDEQDENVDRLQELSDEYDIPTEVIKEYANDRGIEISEIDDLPFNGRFDSEEDYAEDMVEQGAISNLSYYLEMYPTDMRILAQEEADSRVDNMDDDELLYQADTESEADEYDSIQDEISDLKEEINDLQDDIDEIYANEDEDVTESESEENDAKADDLKAEKEEKERELEDLEDKFASMDSRDELIEKAREDLREQYYDEIYEALEKDAVGYFVDELGYSAEDLAKNSSFTIDYKFLAKELGYDVLYIEHNGDVYVFSNYERGGMTYAKGGNIPTIEKRVAEVNKLIAEGNDKGLEVVDESTTWQSPMKYKPLKYSNGVLYVEYEELDLYKHNRGGGSEWKKEKYRVGKNEMGMGLSEGSAQKETLTDIARMYRKAINSFNKYGYADGGMMAKGGEIKKGDIVTLKNDVKASYENKILPKGTEMILKATPYYTNKKGYFVYAITKDGKYEVRTEKSNFKENIVEIMADGGMMAKGGGIPNNYRGKTSENIWNELTENQRIHFMIDHAEEIGLTSNMIPKYAEKGWSDLNEKLQDAFAVHTMMGQYADGGTTDAKTLQKVKVTIKDVDMGGDVVYKGDHWFRKDQLANKTNEQIGDFILKKYGLDYGNTYKYTIVKTKEEKQMMAKGGKTDDNYRGKKEQIIKDLRKIKSGLDGIPPEVFEKDGLIYVSAEDGQHYAEYYDFYINKDLEKVANKYGSYWEWEDAGSIVFAPEWMWDMKMGGITFDEKVESISESLMERKKVSPKVQKDYGKTYNKKEAVESAKRIAGAMRSKENAKKKS
jgi:cell division protein FtsB